VGDGAAVETANAITARVERLRARLSDARELASLEEARPKLPGDFWERPPIVRKGLMFLAMARELATPIRDHELIVGDVPYGEFLANREVLSPHISDSERTELRAGAFERFAERTGRQGAADRIEGLGTVFGMGPNYGHIIADYARPLEAGFGGVRRDVEVQLEALASGEADSRRDSLEASRLAVVGAETYIARYGAAADELAEAEGCGLRRAELRQLGRTCSRIATDPPCGFQEALQMVWFTQLLLEIESGVSAFSFGRLDQYLYPFLEADLAGGALTRRDAQELVDCFWIKANEQNDRCEDAGRAVTIGGVDAEGGDAVNELTHMMLDAAGRLGTRQPKLNARVHGGSPSAYVHRCCEVAARNAGPQLYNDEQIIDALVSFGLPKAEAASYGIIGCYETGVPGKERPWPMSGCLNLGKCLELALNGGVCRQTGRQLGPSGGTLRELSSYGEVERAYESQVEFFLERMAEKSALDECLDTALRPQPFLSSLVQGCISSGRDVSDGGAVHSNTGIRCTGFSAVADSLSALKTLVFEKRSVDRQTLSDALEADYVSYEPLREMLASDGPKYGNDNDVADRVARHVGEHFCLAVLEHKNIRGGRMKPGLFSFTSFLPAGKQCGALPNGRRACAPFANGVSPMHGADREGPTAVLRSAAKLRYGLSPNAATLDLRLSPGTARKGVARLADLVRSYFGMGGLQLQLSVLSSDELREAQRRPEDHAGLLVRVAGYSAHFTELEPEVQDEIISRSEHAL